MNEGIHLDLDIWIVPGQIRKANLCRGVGNRYTPCYIIIIIKRRSGINPIPPTVKDRDYKKKQKQRKKINY